MRDQFELLYFVLQELVRETIKYYHYRYTEDTMPSVMEIDAEEFEVQVRRHVATRPKAPLTNTWTTVGQRIGHS